MSLIRQTSLSPLTRLVFAVVLVCALLITQWRLNDHVVEHSANAPNISVSLAVTNDSTTHDGTGCLVCLEHQAHGAALTSSLTLALALTLVVLRRKRCRQTSRIWHLNAPGNARPRLFPDPL